MEVTKYTVKSAALPPAFDGFTVAHVTDLHNREFKSALIAAVEGANPNVIAVTGDSIHRENESDAAERFFSYAVNIASVYLVYGNHEKVLSCRDDFERRISDLGVRVLKNEYDVLSRGDDRIALLGLNDPTFFVGGKPEFIAALGRMQTKIRESGINYTVLLSHRPELFERYCEAGVNLSLTGHAHGGHVRLPFIGAIYAPNQGLMPKLTEGCHSKGDCCTVISKGLGKSSWVPRIFNPPELCVVTLRRG